MSKRLKIIYRTIVQNGLESLTIEKSIVHTSHDRYVQWFRISNPLQDW